jgi:MFS family permease
MAPVRRGLSRQFSSLGQYNYRVFFIGQSMSLVGTWMQTIGQGWLVLKLTGSPAALGVVTMLQFLPFTLLSLVGGVLADRLPKRRTLVIVQSIATVQAGVMAVLAATHTIEIWHIFVLAFVLGCTNAIERPVRQSFFSELVDRDHLVNAVALNSSTLNLARVLGPALGGLTIAAVGVEANFTINCLSFLAVLAGYGLMRPSQFHAGRKKPATGSIGRQIVEGVRYAWATPSMLVIFVLVAFIGTFGYNFNVVVPLVAEFVLKAGPGQFGLLTSALGAGSLVAALAIASAGRQDASRLLIWAGAFSVLLLVLGISRNYWVDIAILASLGITGVALMTGANTTLQLCAPDELRGRIISIFILLQAGSTPIGGLMVGWLSESFGVASAVIIQAVCCMLGVGIGAAYFVRTREARKSALQVGETAAA